MSWKHDSELDDNHILCVPVPNEFDHGQGLADFKVRSTGVDESDSEEQTVKDYNLLSCRGLVRFNLR